MINKQINHGFIPPIITPTDFWLGSKKLGSVILNEKGDWRDYLPTFEPQRKTIEVNACVSFAILSNLEMLQKLQYGNEPNYSDRFLAKLSNTNPNQGNTPSKVADTLRHSGTIPETEWPYDSSSLENYYKEIPQKFIDMGLDWLEDYEIGYEWVDSLKLKEALKRSPVCVAVYAWAQNNKEEYIRLGPSTHYVVLIAYDELDRPVIFDSYDPPGLKTLEKDYKLEFPQMYVLCKKQKKVNFWQRIINYLKKLLL